MKKNNKSESGQALILIVFAIIGLIGMTGLTVDGGIVFSDKRNAQNAADTAALAAGRMMIRSDGDWNVSQAAGFDLAANNGYDNNGTTNIVEVVWPPTLGLYAGDDEYVQVLITSHVQTTFARVVGITQMTNFVTAVAKVIPSTKVHMFEGNAVVGLAPEECKAVKYQGNADTTVTGGGIYVNSNCPNTAFFNNSSAAELTAPSLCSVGGITYEPSAINIDQIATGCDAYDYPVPDYVMPLPDCESRIATKTGNTLSAGSYTGHFPPNGVTNLDPGIYCVNGDFRLNGGDVLNGSNVIIYMESGDISWNGGAEVHLSAPTDPNSPFYGLLIYVPYDNQASITLNGNSGSTIEGTILAPASDIKVDGTGDTGINGQIIGYTVDLSGTSSANIHYDQNFNYEATTPPYLQLTE